MKVFHLYPLTKSKDRLLEIFNEISNEILLNYMGIIGLHNHIHGLTERVVICDSQRGFEFSQLNSLLS